jgi:hypothetical protein
MAPCDRAAQLPASADALRAPLSRALEGVRPALISISVATVLVSAGCGFFGPTVRRPQEVCVRERAFELHRFELQVPYHVSGRNPHNNFEKFAVDNNYWLYLNARERATASDLVLTEHRGVLMTNQAAAGYVELGSTAVTIHLEVREHYWDPSHPRAPGTSTGYSRCAQASAALQRSHDDGPTGVRHAVNLTVERTAGSHSLAAAAHRDR